MAGTTANSISSPPSTPSHGKFGAASPQSVKKLLSLSEQSKTRPIKSPGGGGPTSTSTSMTVVGQSPMNLRRGQSQTHSGVQLSSQSHERSDSSLTLPVDLTAESSSVSSLRKVQNTGKNFIDFLECCFLNFSKDRHLYHLSLISHQVRLVHRQTAD